MKAALEGAVLQSGGRIIAALSARYRDIDLAEEAFADACSRAAETWPRDGVPRDPAAWLCRAAERRGIDALRRRRTRLRFAQEFEPAAEAQEDEPVENGPIPDERLRLIFVCCHPAIAAEARAALTLKLVCGLSTGEIARAFLLSEPTLAQRLVRAKRKIAEAGVPFEVPGAEAWPERLDAVLSTLEVAYSKAHEDAEGAGRHAGYSGEMLEVTRVLAQLLPEDAGTLALAATVRYAEARRPARLSADGVMVPLSDQDPARWRRALIEEADGFLTRAERAPAGWRTIQAFVHRAWCRRRSLEEPPPWAEVLALYDRLLELRDDAVVRLNRAVALAEMEGPAAALDEIEQLGCEAFEQFAPYHAVRADLLRRLGRTAAARTAYDAALALGPAAAERIFLERHRTSLG